MHDLSTEHLVALPLLCADEPAPFEVVNPLGSSELVIIVDHASNRIPMGLRQLGLDAVELDSHIAWDAGAAAVARELARLLDAPLILANYSRLVIDCNRAADSAQAIVQISDGVAIPGNRQLTAAQRDTRRTTLHEPYHQAIGQLLDARAGRPTALLAMHSFAPMLQGGPQRPWHLGVCYGDDSRMAAKFLAGLRPLKEAVIGDNEPYTIEKGIDFSLPHHAKPRALQHVMLEFRYDILDTPAAVSAWAARLARVWRDAWHPIGI